MRKTLVALLLVMASVSFTFAQENMESLTQIVGTAMFSQDENGQTVLKVEQEDGSLVLVMFPEAELTSVQDQVKDNDRITVEGFMIGSDEEKQMEAHILARTINVNGNVVTISNPIELTEEEIQQIRDDYSAKQDMQKPEGTGTDMTE